MKKWLTAFLCTISICSAQFGWATHGASSQPTNHQPMIMAESPNIADLLTDAGVPKFIIAKPEMTFGKSYLNYLTDLMVEVKQDETNFNLRYTQVIFVGNLIPRKNSSKGYYQLSATNIANIPNQIEALGKSLGNTTIAHKNAMRLNILLSQYRTSQKEERAVPFVIIIHKEQTSNAYIVVGTNTFLSQLWDMVGGVNLIQQPGLVKVSSNELNKLNPKVIIYNQSDSALSQELSSKNSVGVDPAIFFSYSPHIIDQGLPEAAKILAHQ